MLATLRKWCLPFLACLVAARAARAADDDPLAISSAPSTIRAHEYSLAECMALAESNFPTLWAARARLAYAHAQLDEAKWTPWSQWTANSTFGVAPPLLGSVIFPQSSLSATNISSVNDLQPFFKFHVEGVIPIYTWGKIDSAIDAAAANVRVNEWDMEKSRQQMRLDVRKAWYGLQLARDAKYVAGDALQRID